MYRKSSDVRWRWDYRRKDYVPNDPERIEIALSGLDLMSAIRKQGWTVSDVYQENRRMGLTTYPMILGYVKARKPMQNIKEKLDIWHDLKETCDRLGIFWEGFGNLPELPDDDF